MTREEIILPFIKNKDVLDIGSVGEKKKYSLWNFLKQNTGQLTGIDLRISQDPDIVRGNMENYHFAKRFEVIVAGDVLIQTDNQGLFLDNINKHLDDNGYLILTLPNAKWPTVFLRPSKLQTGWHDKDTLRQLLERHRFKLISLFYYYGNLHNLEFLRKLIAFRQAMVAVCAKDN